MTWITQTLAAIERDWPPNGRLAENLTPQLKFFQRTAEKISVFDRFAALAFHL